jgi:hypothetical protein
VAAAGLPGAPLARPARSLTPRRRRLV